MTLTGFGLFAALIIRSSLLIPAIEMGATGLQGQRYVWEPKRLGPWGAALSRLTGREIAYGAAFCIYPHQRCWKQLGSVPGAGGCLSHPGWC